MIKGYEYTKGPWMAKRHKDRITCGYEILPAANSDEAPPIAYSYGNNNDECIANARLIAAAPDMLEALEELLLITLSRGEKLGLDDRGPVLDKARAAIMWVKKGVVV